MNSAGENASSTEARAFAARRKVFLVKQEELALTHEAKIERALKKLQQNRIRQSFVRNIARKLIFGNEAEGVAEEGSEDRSTDSEGEGDEEGAGVNALYADNSFSISPEEEEDLQDYVNERNRFIAEELRPCQELLSMSRILDGDDGSFDGVYNRLRMLRLLERWNVSPGDTFDYVYEELVEKIEKLLLKLKKADAEVAGEQGTVTASDPLLRALALKCEVLLLRGQHCTRMKDFKAARVVLDKALSLAKATEEVHGRVIDPENLTGTLQDDRGFVLPWSFAWRALNIVHWSLLQARILLAMSRTFPIRQFRDTTKPMSALSEVSDSRRQNYTAISHSLI